MTSTGSNLGSVSTLRTAVIVVMLAIVCSACIPSSSGNLDVQTGCTSITTKRAPATSGVAMTVRAAGCPDAATAVDRIAAAVWRSLRQPVDEIRIEVPARDGYGAPLTVALSRGVLTDRFGDGPSGPVVAAAERDDDISLWLLLPVAWIAAGLGALAMVYGAARAGAVLFVIR
ncbi:hypothetical protein [Pseudonocardia sp. KRD291]|uniref:hypothetical protein n=1 Tax=Pseudonocardia sp. KRD291 TaxID=2792007 RepID=UPI001C4A080A|nr:hypothetical protein [Pseudonocardia sp. KRD291]MBW0101417.1 hypothetical protein [Pseudonocardia sp. KRD291]